jgi:DNA-binding NtrC family response regulator
MMNKDRIILVVDDEPISLRMVERLLQQRYTVIAASSGEQALEILSRQQIVLLITDQHMSGITGTELLRRALQMRPDMIGVLLTSANDNETFRDAIINSGALRVVVKPWDAAKLLQIVETCLEKQKSRLENRRAIDQLKDIRQSLKGINER